MAEPPGGPDVTVLRMILDRLNSLDGRIDNLVSSDAFVAEQRRVDDAFNAERRRVDDRHLDLRNDVTEEREARMLEATTIRAAAARTASLVRWTFASIVIPTAGLVAAIVMSMK